MEHQRLSGMDRGRRILPEAGRLNRLSQMIVFLMRLLLKMARRSVGMAWWLLTGVAFFGTLHAAERFVDLGENGKLVYEFDDQGNRMPDFSHAGYAGGGVAIPSVPAKVLVAPLEGDNTRHIQSAIDHVSSLPMDEHGFRGAVCLTEGWFEIHGQLRIESSGLVLRGSGDVGQWRWMGGGKLCGVAVFSTPHDQPQTARGGKLGNRYLGSVSG